MSRVLPILFNTEMVRAILNGRKTATRRCLKPQPIHKDLLWIIGGAGWSDNISVIRPVHGHSLWNRMPYHPGDILYVRETWNYVYNLDDNDQIVEDTGRYVYYADDSMPFLYWTNPDTGERKDKMPWKPSIHMPKDAARIWLRVTDVRAERLQDISGEELMKEGVDRSLLFDGCVKVAFEKFKEIWNSTIKKQDINLYGWDANPWVWVIEFERCERPEEL